MEIKDINFKMKMGGFFEVCHRDEFNSEEEWVNDVFSAIIEVCCGSDICYGNDDINITELSFTDPETGKVYHYENN